jgi:ABC-type uncharacterized transport system auxiliary subunit
MPPAYNQQRIAVRRRSHEISYYQHHYWAMNPADNLTSMIEKVIQESNIFSSASSGNLTNVPDFQISSNIFKLEVKDITDTFQVHLDMRFELIDYVNGKAVLTHQFERSTALEDRDLNLFASEISRIFYEETEQFVNKMSSYLKNRNLQNSATK